MGAAQVGNQVYWDSKGWHTLLRLLRLCPFTPAGGGPGLIPILLMHGFPDEYWRTLLLSSEAWLAMENSFGRTEKLCNGLCPNYLARRQAYLDTPNIDLFVPKK